MLGEGVNKMKKFCSLLLCIFLLGCATTGLHTVILKTTEQFENLELILPNEVSDFTTWQSYWLPLTDKYCAIVFIGHNIVYKLIVNCKKPKVYALIETRVDDIKSWIYVKGIPIKASIQEIRNLVEGIELSKI